MIGAPGMTFAKFTSANIRRMGFADWRTCFHMDKNIVILDSDKKQCQALCAMMEEYN